MYQYAEECSKNGLSIVAIDKDNGRVAGAFFNKDNNFTIPFPKTDNMFSKFMNATFNKLWDESKHPLKEVSNNGEAIDFLLIGVSSKYIGKKIGSKLCELSFKLAQ